MSDRFRARSFVITHLFQHLNLSYLGCIQPSAFLLSGVYGVGESSVNDLAHTTSREQVFGSAFDQYKSDEIVS